MLELRRKKTVKFAKAIRGDKELTLAFLVITQGDKIVFVSEPRMVKISQINVLKLSSGRNLFLLTAPKTDPLKNNSIPSPYVEFFIELQTEVPFVLISRPPTQKI